MMLIIKFILGIFLGWVSWLLYGAPDTSLIGNLFIWGCTFFHIWLIIFNREVFGLFGGDVFTYGMANLGINLVGMVWTLIGGFIIFYSYDRNIYSLSMVPSIIWGVLLLGILASILLPLLTTRKISPLPKRDDRRNFEPPRSD